MWVGSQYKYQLTASGSFLDALSYIKPVIYLRNPYIEYYAEQMGDIGYQCSNYDDIRDTISSILERFPEEKYKIQCNNILNNRKIFMPENLSTRLQSILNH